MKTTLCIALFAIAFNIRAQNSLKGNVIIDDKVIAENNSVDCYNFKKLQISFPITKEMFMHDRLIFNVKMSNTDTSFNVKFEYCAALTNQDAISNFQGKTTGVVTIVDENRDKIKSIFEDRTGPIKVKEFYTCTEEKLKYKPVEVSISVTDITGYEEKYDEYKRAIVKVPVFGNEKYLFRLLIKFYNPFVPATYSAVPLTKMLGKAKLQAKEEEQTKKVKDCNVSSIKDANVLMNTDVDLDSFYGYIKK